MKTSYLKSASGIALLAILYFGFFDSQTDYDNCFEEKSILLSDAIEINKYAIWDKDKRKNKKKYEWSVPSLVEFEYPNSFEKKLMEQGFKGYLFDNSSMLNSEPLNKAQEIEFTGEMIIVRYSWFEQLFSHNEKSVYISIKVNGNSYLTFDHALSTKLLDIVENSSCYK